MKIPRAIETENGLLSLLIAITAMSQRSAQFFKSHGLGHRPHVRGARRHPALAQVVHLVALDRAANKALLSNRGQRNQSIEPLRLTSAAVVQSPISA